MVSGQLKLSKEEIKQKNDSILAEGDLLYRYEKAAWVSTDLAMSLKDIKENFGGYLIYRSVDSIKAIILGKDHATCIYEMTFFGDPTNPFRESFENRKLNDTEEELQSIKTKMVKESLQPAYQVVCAEGYSLVIELIPYESGYKLYVLTGTSKRDIIPMGNDYVFFAGTDGEITSWRKFHSELIPAKTKIQDQKVLSIIHTHLVSEPFISATDICTFRLYAGFYGLKQFKVLSTALSKCFTYDSVKNSIETEDI
jgi:hypothetical protein